MSNAKYAYFKGVFCISDFLTYVFPYVYESAPLWPYLWSSAVIVR
jgi:hypothetical protein